MKALRSGVKAKSEIHFHYSILLYYFRFLSFFLNKIRTITLGLFPKKKKKNSCSCRNAVQCNSVEYRYAQEIRTEHVVLHIVELLFELIRPNFRSCAECVRLINYLR